MAKTLAEIEKIVRYYTGNRKLVLAVDPGLNFFNSMYRGIARAVPWPEFRVLVRDDNIKTVSGTNVYDWLGRDIIDGGASDTTTSSAEPFWFEIDGGSSTDSAFPLTVDGGSSFDNTTVFSDVVAVEVGDSSATDAAYNLMISPPSEAEWGKTASDDDGVPVYYVRFSQGGTNKMELRPAPDYNNATIQVTGYEEPENIVYESDTTSFTSDLGDDILARILSANYYFGKSNVNRGMFHLQQATEDLRIIFGRELVPSELTMNIIANG